MDSNRLVGLRLVNVVGGFVLGWGDVVEGAVEADGVEPGDPGQCGEFDVVDGRLTDRGMTNFRNWRVQLRPSGTVGKGWKYAR